jgi:hypothetical protein
MLGEQEYASHTAAQAHLEWIRERARNPTHVARGIVALARGGPLRHAIVAAYAIARVILSHTPKD